MKRKRRIVVACFLATAVPAFAGQTLGNGGIAWIDNIPEAYREAKASDKPMLIAFRCVP